MKLKFGDVVRYDTTSYNWVCMVVHDRSTIAQDRVDLITLSSPITADPVYEKGRPFLWWVGHGVWKKIE